MRELPLEIAPPVHLEDAVVLIETAGHLPELALEEVIFHELGEVSEQERAYLEAAVARTYFKLIHCDLDPRMIGRARFRGPGRAVVNWQRLESFLRRGRWRLGSGQQEALARVLEGYLGVEQRALEQGRAYATIAPREIEVLARAWGVDLGRWRGLIERVSTLQVADFLALRALRRLEVEGVVFKRRRWKGASVVIEVLDQGMRPLRSASLPLAGPWGRALAEDIARVELVWTLAGLKAGWTYAGQACGPRQGEV